MKLESHFLQTFCPCPYIYAHRHVSTSVFVYVCLYGCIYVCSHARMHEFLLICMSASDWCALREALYKLIDTIQYNTFCMSIHNCLHVCMYEFK